MESKNELGITLTDEELKELLHGIIPLAEKGIEPENNKNPEVSSAVATPGEQCLDEEKD